MAEGRKLIWRRSAGFTPSTLKATDSAKNAMPNDMANRGCRTVPQMGCIAPEAQAWARSIQPIRGCGGVTLTPTRLGVTPVVGVQEVFSPLTAGLASQRCLYQVRGASTFARRGAATAR